MKWVTAIPLALVIAGVAFAAEWKQVGDKYEATETIVQAYDQATVYNAKEQVKAWANLLARLNCSNLSPEDADMLAGIANNLKQGRSIADQRAMYNKLVAEIPTVPKPVVDEKDEQ